MSEIPGGAILSAMPGVSGTPTATKEGTVASRPGIVILCAVLMSCPPLAAAADSPAIEPGALSLLTAALTRIGAAQRLSFRAEVTNETALPDGEKIQFSGVLTALVRRPDGLRLELDGERRATLSWFDGKTFTHFDRQGNAYASCPAPGTIEGLVPTMRDKLGFTPALAPLLVADVVPAMLGRLRSGYTVGRAMTRGVPTTHLAFREEHLDLQVWISEEGAPKIERIVLTYREEAGAPQFSAAFTDWNFDARAVDADFAFTPPAGSVACEFKPPAGAGKGARP
jgi:hypothetical protein